MEIQWFDFRSDDPYQKKPKLNPPYLRRDDNSPVLVEEDFEGIQLPESNFVLQEDHFEALQAIIDPEADSDSYWNGHI